MRRKEITLKFLIIVFTFAVIIWIGGSLLRNIIAFDLFVPATELSLKNYYSQEVRLHTIHLYSVGSVYTGIAFSVAVICSVMLFILTSKRLKENGWLFMSFIMFFLVAVLESYNLYLDIMLGMAISNNEIDGFSSPAIKEYFLFRYYKLGILEPLKYLAILTIIAFIVWKPLNKRQDSYVEQIIQER